MIGIPLSVLHALTYENNWVLLNSDFGLRQMLDLNSSDKDKAQEEPISQAASQKSRKQLGGQVSQTIRGPEILYGRALPDIQ